MRGGKRNLNRHCDIPLQRHTGTRTEQLRISSFKDLTTANQLSDPPPPTLSPTDPVPRGLLTLCPAANSGPQGLYTAHIQPIHSLYTHHLYTVCLFIAVKVSACHRSISACHPSIVCM